jgi:hypothetical protein
MSAHRAEADSGALSAVRDLSIRFLFQRGRADRRSAHPTKFEIVINLKTAKALGLDVPLQPQHLAGEMIE